MSESAFNKRSAAIHAIAITLAMAIISGYLPLLPSVGNLSNILQLPLKAGK